MKLMTALLLVPAIAFGVAACDVKKTEEGKMPDVNVDVTEGNIPKYDVDAPDVDVKMEEKTIEVPTLDVDSAAQDEKEEKAGTE